MMFACAENMSREVLSLCEVLDCLLQAYQPLIQVSIHTYCGILQHTILQYTVQYTTIYYNIPQYVSVPQYITVYLSISQYITVYCIYYSILQYTTIY